VAKPECFRGADADTALPPVSYQPCATVVRDGVSPCLCDRSQRRGPWRHLEAVEWATLTWVDWFNTRRLLDPLGYVPPAEYEARYYEQAKVA
jgi:transposase InsO family protein